jgi:hypothetical protein
MPDDLLLVYFLYHPRYFYICKRVLHKEGLKWRGKNEIFNFNYGTRTTFNKPSIR